MTAQHATQSECIKKWTEKPLALQWSATMQFYDVEAISIIENEFNKLNL